MEHCSWDSVGPHQPYATRVWRDDGEEEEMEMEDALVVVVVAEELELDKELDMDEIPIFGQ